jgi:GNAT superfamily N-acetyltransferase
MSFLDYYPSLQRDAAAAKPMGLGPLPSEAVTAQPAMESYTHPNPQTFSEAYSTAWNEDTQFAHATAFANARSRALYQRAQQLEKLTGDQTLQPSLSQFGGVEKFNARLEHLRQIYPEYADQMQPWSDEQLAEEGLRLSKESREQAKAFQMRPGTWASFAGDLLGRAAAWPTDMVNQVTGIAGYAALPATGVLAAFGKEAAIGGAGQIAQELAGGPYRTQVEPGYFATAEPYTNVAGATIISGALGSVVAGAGAAYRRFFKARPDTPPHIRDAGNVIESEEFTQVTNPLAGQPEGDVAHRQAFGRALKQVIDGEPVDVSDIITPEMTARAQEIMSMTERTRRPVTYDEFPTTEGDPVVTAPPGRPPGRADPNAPDATSETIAQPRLTDAAVTPAPRHPTTVEVREAGSVFIRSEADPGNFLTLKVGDDAVYAGIATIGKAERGTGLGTSLYERAIQFAQEQGLPFRSDISVNADATRVYESLRRRGYEVTEAPGTTKTKAGATNATAGYVYEVRPPKARVEPQAGAPTSPVEIGQIRPHLRQQLERELDPALMERYLKGGEPELMEEVARNFDRLRADNPNLQVPVQVQRVQGEEPKTVFRSADDVMKPIEEDELVAREISLCVGSQPAGAG